MAWASSPGTALGSLPASWSLWLPGAWVVLLVFCFFCFFGEKVDQLFSLSLLWMLSLSAWRQGGLRPWRLDQATCRSAALCSLSGPKSSTFAFNKEELDLEAVEGLWCQHSWKGPGSWRAFITLPLGQFRGDGHLPLQSPGSLALLHWVPV